MEKIEKLISKLSESNFDAALIMSPSNRLYFSEFNSSEGAILILKEEAYFLVDFRYYESAKAKVKNMKVILMTNFSESLKDLIKDKEIKNIVIEQNFITLNQFNFLKSIFKDLNVSIVDNNVLDKIISDLRMIKSDTEIKKIKAAQKISESAFKEILKEIKPEVTEKQIANKLEYLIKLNGAEAVAFDLIVLSGKNTSLPHGVPSDKKIRNGDFVTIDMGATYKGYRSDMTRTVAVGNISDFQKEVYDTVLNAQLSALSKVKPFLACSTLDACARDIIDGSKFKGTFGHSLGHGVGIDIHEEPFVSKNSRSVLKEGMVITIEPGIYLENEFGVRIEDMVLVSKDSYENLTTITKDLIIL